jgi:drug/metabolite transporter (DMT)-like permease
MSLKRESSFQEDIFERKESKKINSKNEILGIIYCLITQLIWTINSICLKYFINSHNSIFKNKTFLFSRGLSTIIISLILGKIQDGKIYSFNFFNSTVQKCILAKANLSFFAMCFWTVAVSYLRITTCQVISSLSPILVITFSVFLLKEKFYNRYILGIICGVVGSVIIILDEKKIKDNENRNSSSQEYVIGVISIALNIVLSSFNNISNKYMAPRVSIHTQMFYFGIFHCAYSLLWMIFTWDFDYTLEYFFGCALTSILLFLGNFFYNLSLSKISMSKYSILQYSKFVMAFILGWGVLKEEVLMNDMYGTTIIGGFMVFNVIFPIKKEKKQ